MELRNNCIYMPRLIESEMGFFVNDKVTQPFEINALMVRP